MEIVKDKIGKIFNYLGLPYSSLEIVDDQEVDLIIVSISTEHDKYWLANDGEPLRELNYLLRKIIPLDKGENFLVDINLFQQKKLKDLKTKAKIIADRVKSFGIDIEVEPMSSYDRMVFHSYISKVHGVRTQSFGYGKERHIVVSVADE